MAVPIVAILAGLAVVGLAKGAGGGSSSPKAITTGSAFLRKGKAYRIELEVGGKALTEAAHHPSLIADGVRNGLGMNGGYDIYISPSIPLQVSYSLIAQGDTPLVLNIAAQQTIGGLVADYTFRSVQQIAAPKTPS